VAFPFSASRAKAGVLLGIGGQNIAGAVLRLASPCNFRCCQN
jgi:hypothetical protein